jgi:hypothetical protein
MMLTVRAYVNGIRRQPVFVIQNTPETREMEKGRRCTASIFLPPSMIALTPNEANEWREWWIRKLRA